MLRVLGAVEIDGRDTLRSRAQRIVLSALVLDLGDVVSADRLIDLVWGDEAPGNPNAALQSHVSRLRGLLPQGVAIRSTGTGYRIEAEANDVDVAAFGIAAHAAETAEPGERVAEVDRALGLWHGLPYEELPDDDRAGAEAARLESIRQHLAELRAASLLATGHVHAAISDLEAQRRTTPFRERTVDLLMRAYVAAGRKSDALAEYQRLRNELVEELGLDPSPELRELERAVLADAPLSDLSGRAGRAESDRAAGPTTGGPARARSAISTPASTFVGRSRDIADVVAALDRRRIVSLVGPGGVGKTRLALHVAEQCAADHVDGATIVELVAIRDPTRLGEAIAGELDLQPRAGVGPDELVFDALERRDLLLVFDNCEHLIDAAAAFTERITRRAPGVTVMTTSREPLNIDGEQVLRIQPLTAREEAVELFVDRARSHDRSFALDDRSRPLVEKICIALDGLPLAIELAASRVSSMSLAEIVDGLQERFVVLAHGRRTAHERHRSLHALVQWSVRGLDEPLLQLFTGMSVFVAPFTPAAAGEVLGRSESAAQAVIAELVDRSLLVEHRDPDRPTRYGFLETIRAFARELLEAGDATAADRHAQWALAQAEATRALMPARDDTRAVAELVAIMPEVRVAHRYFLESGDADRSLRLAASLDVLAFLRLHAEMLAWIVETADHFGRSDHPLAEDVLAAAAIATWLSGNLDGAAVYADLAAERAVTSDRTGAGRGAAEARADVLQFGGDNRSALQCFLDARELARADGNATREAMNAADAAMVAGYLGEVDAARKLIDAAHRIVTPDGSILLRAWCAYAEGEALADHDPERAVTALTSAIELAEAAGLNFVTGTAGLTLTGLQIRSGEPSDAAPRLIDLLGRWQRTGSRLQAAITLRTVVDLLVRLERFEDAATVLGGLRSGDDAAAASGADRDRLAAARAAIASALPDATPRLDDGAERELDEIVTFAMWRLRDIASG